MHQSASKQLKPWSAIQQQSWAHVRGCVYEGVLGLVDTPSFKHSIPFCVSFLEPLGTGALYGRILGLSWSWKLSKHGLSMIRI